MTIPRSIINAGVCIGIVLFGSAATMGIVFARQSPSVSKTLLPKVTNVEISTLQETMVQDTITVTGSLEPWKEVLLSSEAKGKIEWLGVEEGDTTTAGDELLKVDRASAEARHQQGQIEYALAALVVERLIELGNKGIGSVQDLDKARVDRDVAKANLNIREMELDYTTVVAPFNGIVDETLQEKDEFVNIGTPLVSLIQIHKVKMVVGIADQDVPYFSVGDSVTVLVDAYKEKKFPGTINRIGQRADSNTHTFETEIELDNWVGALKPGMIARAVLTRKNYPDSITIPIFSILTDEKQKFVFVERDGKAVKTPVTILLHQGNVAVVEEGLISNDRLIVAGHRNLRDQDLVTVQGTQP
jgi:membrane fusion protein (multidrug efflux system)